MKILTIVFTAIFIISFLSVLSIKPVSAQIILPQGQTYFTVAIVYYPLQFSGDLNSLRIYWNASYLGGSASQIGVKCYVNCNPLDPNNNECAGFPNNCTYLGPPGVSACTIQPMAYAYPLNTPENATCIFYNPAKPAVEYKKPDGTYPNATFYPINFNLYLVPNFTVSVGKPISLSFVVQNIGVFNDSYIQTLTAYPGNLISLDTKTQSATFGSLVGNSYGNTPQSFNSLAKFTLLSTTAPVNLVVDVNSTTNSTIEQEQVLRIQAGVSSLPDFGWLGLLQIIALASLILFFIRKRL